MRDTPALLHFRQLLTAVQPWGFMPHFGQVPSALAVWTPGHMAQASEALICVVASLSSLFQGILPSLHPTAAKSMTDIAQIRTLRMAYLV